MVIVCGVGIVLLIILLLPIRFSITANNTEGLVIGTRISYGRGLVSCSFGKGDADNEAVVKMFGLTVGRFSPADDDGQSDPLLGVVARLKARKKLLVLLPDIIRDILDAVLGVKARMGIRLGFDDPAYTGMAAGLAAYALNYFGGILRYTPDFSGESFELDLYIKGAVIPLMLLLIGVKYGIIYLREQMLEARKN